MTQFDNHNFEVIIIGGSYAGLSAAMTLGRALRHVLVIDGGNPCNRYAPLAHNFPGFDGESPQFIADKIIDQVKCYPTIKYIKGFATHISGSDNDFKITVDSNTYTARKVLLATGVSDILPEIKGFTECWGKTAIHCPYCHGYEVAGMKIAVLAHGDAGIKMANLIRQWSTEIHILTNGKEDFSKQELQRLHDKETRVITKEIKEIVSSDGKISKVIFIDNTEETLDAIYVRVGVKQTNTLAKELGCDFDKHDFIIVDDHNRTKINGVFAAGDNMSAMRSLTVAIASGTTTGIYINTELID